MSKVSEIAGRMSGALSGDSADKYKKIAGAAALSVAVVVGLLYWSSGASYAPLMTNLSSEDAAEITDKLRADNIPFRMSASGSVLLVPAERVHQVRLRLAGEGLPRGGGVGFELFDDSGIGVSRFTEQLNYRRALEGELARTIRQFDAIQDVRVHVVVPKKALFKTRQKARASAAVRMRRGRQLSEEQVQAIVHLLASSVEGLSPDEVTVVDGRGRILAKPGQANNSMEAIIDHQREVESELERRVTDILETTLGTGKVSVKVAVDLDKRHTEVTKESYDPDMVVLRSSQTSEEGAGTKADEIGGVPGARSKLTGAAGAAKSGGHRRSETKNYEISKVTTKEVKPSARLTRVSVAVLVDGARKNADGKLEPRSPEEIARLTEIVKRAVGFDSARGDQVVVEAMPFIDADAAAADSLPAWLMYVRQLAAPGLALFVVLAVVVALLRTRSRAKLPELLQGPRSLRELEAVYATITPDAPELDAEPAKAQLAAASPLQSIMDQASTDPERAAAVLRSWLNEGEQHA